MEDSISTIKENFTGKFSELEKDISTLKQPKNLLSNFKKDNKVYEI